MSNTPDPTDPEANESLEAPETTPEDFKDLLRQYEQSHASVSETGQKQINATVAAVTADAVLLDIGYKTEGILPLTAFSTPPSPGDSFIVISKGRNEDGYYQLSLLKFAQPRDWKIANGRRIKTAAPMLYPLADSGSSK